MKFKINFLMTFKIIKYLWNFNRIFNWTPLIHSAYEGHKDIVKLLLSQPGIEINCKNFLIQKY